MILYKTCKALGGTPYMSDSLYILNKKIVAISGVSMTSPWLVLFRAVQTAGGSPSTGDTYYMLIKKLSDALTSGSGGPNDIETFAGDPITTFGGDTLELFT